MEPEAASELARKGVPLLLLDVPQHTVLGVDTQVFSVGPRLKGIKMVGPHFVYYCSPSRYQHGRQGPEEESTETQPGGGGGSLQRFCLLNLVILLLPSPRRAPPSVLELGVRRDLRAQSDVLRHPRPTASTGSSGGGAAAAARMDPEAATELARKGVTLLLLDVPQHTVLGVDTQVFSVGPRFKGIKMVPPGPHFVYYCSPSRHGSEFAPTVGFFLTTHPSEVIVRIWNAQEERLVTLSEDEEIRYSEAVKRFEFDDHLGPYNLDSFGDWKQLSSYLSQSVIERLEPIGREITIALETSWMDRAPQTDMERRLMEQLRQDKFAKNVPAQPERRGCYYTTIPASVKHKNISADELTLLNLDRTSLLESVLAKNYQGQEDLLLGELQFSFIAFMMGQSLEAFIQWKALVSLLLSCTEAPLHMRTQMFLKFIRVIYYQFKHGFQRTHESKSSEDKGNSLFLDEAWFSRDVFLYRLSKDFLSVIFEATVVDGDLLSWSRKLKSLLETTFGWDLEANLIDEDDEFAPVVVEIDALS